MVLGLHIEFIETPSLTNVPASQLSLSPDQRAVLSAEIADLERKEAIHCLSPNNIDLGFYSNLFAVPKKGGGMETSHKLKEVKHFHSHPLLKDGEYQSFEGSPPPRRLPNENRSQACLFNCTYESSVVEVSPLHLKRDSV